MQKAYRFRLYPNSKHEKRLLKALDLCRQTYNELLAEFNKWDYISKFELQSIIPDMKICNPEFKSVYSKVLQYENYRLFSNLKALSEKKSKGSKVGMLRFKGKGWFKTFTYNQSGFKLTNNRLRLSKIGNIPIKVHRQVKGKIKQITIKHEASDKWFASVIAESNDKPKQKSIKNIVGIDLGVKDIVYDSEGNKIENPKFLQTHAKRLAFIQKCMSRKQKGSNNRRKYRIKLARQYEKLTNTRNDFLHKLSRFYVNRYDAIGLEDFIVSNMVRHSYFSKSLLDACFGRLRNLIAYKAESAGKLCVFVDHKGTTQRCSNCQNTVKKDLSIRIHSCPNCGLEIPRDYNSAREIKNLTVQNLEQLGQGLPEVKPVEISLAAELANTARSTSHVSKKQELYAAK